MKPKHTGWEVDGDEDSVFIRAGFKKIFHGDQGDAEYLNTLLYVVACVNACEGIADPSSVPEMLEALRAVHKGLFLHSEYPRICEQVDAVIARAEGKS